MIKPSTLADELYQITFLPPNKVRGTWTNMELLRRSLFKARRFVLDDHMSSFLGDLATAAFIAPVKNKIKRNVRLAEQLRMSARLPHSTTWVEYNLYATLQRSQELVGEIAPPAYDVPEREGWLLQQDRDTDTITAHLFNTAHNAPSDGSTHWIFPWCYAWSVSDAPLTIPPSHLVSQIAREHTAGMLTGLVGYQTDKLDAMMSPFFAHPEMLKVSLDLLTHWTGAARRMWALLASINDIPVVAREVKAAKGFMARGAYHRFLDHRTITLHVPMQKDVHVIARNVIAAARRRAHMVRAHWRQDWRHMPAKQCQHEWTAEQTCKHCHGHRSWVHEHQRGDASLGVVMTDYDVRH